MKFDIFAILVGMSNFGKVSPVHVTKEQIDCINQSQCKDFVCFCFCLEVIEIPDNLLSKLIGCGNKCFGSNFPTSCMSDCIPEVNDWSVKIQKIRSHHFRPIGFTESYITFIPRQIAHFLLSFPWTTHGWEKGLKNTSQYLSQDYHKFGELRHHVLPISDLGQQQIHI